MKKIEETTDRELLERIAVNSKKSADAATFTKNFVVIGIVLTIISIILTMAAK
jgi:hypothetical protein